MFIIHNPISYQMLLLRWNTVKAKTIMEMIATNELEPYIALKYVKINCVNCAYCNKAITTERGGIKSRKQDIVFDFKNVEFLEEANNDFSVIDNKIFHVVEKRFVRNFEITQVLAAEICGVSERTIQNWEKNFRRPKAYPGRNDKDALVLFGINHKREKAHKKNKRSVSRLIYTDAGTLELMANTNCINRD